MSDATSLVQRLDRMVDELSAHKQVAVIAWMKRPGADDAAIKKAESALGAKLHPSIERFYRETNGACLLWHDKKSEEYRDRKLKKLKKFPMFLEERFTGGFLLLPIEVVFGDSPAAYSVDPSEDEFTCYGRTEPRRAFSERVRPFDLPGSFYSAAFLVEPGEGDPKVVVGDDHGACYTDSYITTFERYIAHIIGSFASVEDRFRHYNARSIRRAIEAPPDGDGDAYFAASPSALGDYLVPPRDPERDAALSVVYIAWDMSVPQRKAALPSLMKVLTTDMYWSIAYLRRGVDDETSDAVGPTLWSLLPPVRAWGQMTKATRTTSAFWPSELVSGLAGLSRHDPRQSLPILEEWAEYTKTGTTNTTPLWFGTIAARSGPEGRALAARWAASPAKAVAEASLIARMHAPLEHRSELVALLTSVDPATSLVYGENGTITVPDAAIEAIRAAVYLGEADPSSCSLSAPLLAVAVRSCVITWDQLAPRAAALLWTHDADASAKAIAPILPKGLAMSDAELEVAQRVAAPQLLEAILAPDVTPDNRFAGLKRLVCHATDPAIRARIAGALRAGLKDKSLKHLEPFVKSLLLFE